MATEANMFISYSHKDGKWLERLRTRLDPLLRSTEYIAFDDQGGIKPGDPWREQIDTALETARVAVLLVSSDFLNSKFIMDIEWPRLEARARSKQVTILWVPLRPSAVEEFSISEYQSAGPSTPLSKQDDAQQEESLVEIAKAIRTALQDARGRRPVGHGATTSTTRATTLIREYPISLGKIEACALDVNGRIWLSTGHGIHVYDAHHDGVDDRWALPNRRWKACLERTWNARLVMSDWDGNVCAYPVTETGPSRAEVFMARPDSLPFHLLAAGTLGELYAASWNGDVIRFDAEGSNVSRTTVTHLAALPVDLVPLSAAALAVVTRDNVIHCYDGEGKEAWCWKAQGEIRSVIPCSAGVEAPVIALIGPNRLVKIQAGDVREELRIPGKVLTLARRERGDDTSWLLAVDDQNSLHWIATSSLAVVPELSVDLAATVQEIVGICARESSAALLAVALTTEGQVVTVNEHAVEKLELRREYTRLIVDPDRHRLWLVADAFLDVYECPLGFPENEPPDSALGYAK